jgi:hypothetical protein
MSAIQFAFMFPVFLSWTKTGHISEIYVPGFSLFDKDRAHIRRLCSRFLPLGQRPGTYSAFMFPVSPFWTKTGHISEFYVPDFSLLDKDRAHIYYPNPKKSSQGI